MLGCQGPNRGPVLGAVRSWDVFDKVRKQLGFFSHLSDLFMHLGADMRSVVLTESFVLTQLCLPTVYFSFNNVINVINRCLLSLPEYHQFPK